MSSKRKYNLVDVVDDTGLLDLSEEVLIDDDDTDRESNFHLSDTDSSQEETDFEIDNMLIDEPSISGVCNVANSPSPVEQNPLGSDDDDETEWITVDETYSPSSNVQFTGQSGISQDVTLTKESLPIEFFKLFVTQSILRMMVTKTNRYAEQLLAQSEVKEKSRLKRWVSTSVTEISKFIGLLFAMGLIKKSHLAEYWSTNPVMATPFFNKTMPRDRFELLLRCWHFATMIWQ